MTKEKLAAILEAHEAWLNNDPSGSRADLSEADLRWADLRWADLRWANLSEADLRWADLSEADLRWADLRWANLSEANLSEADLSEANLSEADLRWADLRWANLSKSNLSGADLRWADLSEANLSEANLSEADLSEADLRWADLSRADLSGAEGLLKSCNYLDAYFERTADGYIAYKTFGGKYKPPVKWTIAPGSVIEENVNPNRSEECGCGINVAPLKWVRKNYGDGDVWKVLIRWEWLAGVVVPYNTDGKIRCERVELLEAVE